MTQQNTTSGRICAEEYTVKRGDSFYLIAHKLGVPLRDLLAANSGIHPARLMVGDVLCVPREEDEAGGGLGSGNISGSTGSAGGSVSGGIAGSGGSTDSGSSITGTPSGGTGGSGTTGGGTSGGTSGGGTSSGTGGSGTTGSGSSGGTSGGGTTGGTSGGTGGSGTGGGSSSGGTSGGGTTTTPQCPLDEQLIIQRGQTVADIQLLNLVSRNTLETANPNVNLDALRVGQTLCVPKENIACAVPTTYTLGTTENLEAVAVQFNLPVASILRANPCLAPQDFEAGVTVVIPR